MAGERRKARRVALQTLYEIDSVAHPPEPTLERLLAERPLPETAAAFARELVQGVLEHQAQLDATIASLAPAWPLSQMPKVDKNILRLAIFEVLFHNKVPTKVAINEAVELAKTFGSDSSPKFVNGVLGALVDQRSPRPKGST